MKIVFFKSNFRVTIPGNLTISGYCNPEISQFPSNNTLILKMAGYCYPETDPAFLPFFNFWVLLPGSCFKKNLFS